MQQITYKPIFTFIIPFQYRPDRILSLRRVVDWLSGFQGGEVLIVEQGKNSQISGLNIRANHMFVESEMPFNKSWLYNIAIKRVSSPIVIFMEADTIMNPLQFIEALKIIDGYDCVFAANNVIKLSISESQQDFSNILNIDRTEPKQNLCDGISIFKRDSIWKIGGWNEDIMGLDGYDNKFQDFKIKKTLNWKEMEYKSYHLFHFPDRISDYLKNRNSQIFDHFNNSDISALRNHINQSVQKIGQINKYKN
jgi:hypothetical protein